MGSSSKSKPKKAKKSKKTPHTAISELLLAKKDEFVRRFKLFVLNFDIKNNYKHKQQLLASLVALFFLLNVFYYLVPTHSGLRVRVGAQFEVGDGEGLDASDIAVKEELPPLEQIEKDLGGFGEIVKGEEAIMKENGVKMIQIGNSAQVLRSMNQDLQTIEFNANKGWNQSSAKVLPLGQLGYVKRDLPVYKDGLQRLDLTVLNRPKSGIYTTEQLSGTSYNILICLSFNTDHCFDPNQHDKIGDHRKVNRIQNLRDVVWSKNKFCKTISSATRGLADQELLSFTFPCWVMPGDFDRMIKYAKENDVDRWIAKPRSLGAGMGIYIVNNMEELQREKSKGNVIQTYLEDPHLIEKEAPDGSKNTYKWDMRTYVLVTSVTPLRAYIYDRGLVRISTSPYSTNCTKDNMIACLTNTSINKKVEGAQLKDITWSLKKLKEYLAAQGENNWNEIFLRMQKAVGLALLSAESEFLRQFTPKGFTCSNCYQLLGVDLIFDSTLHPKVVEINGEPSLKLTGNGKTHYDFTKRYMARDLVALVYHKSGQSRKAAQRLSQWVNAIDKGQSVIGSDHASYILDTLREHSKLGGFKPVYPNEYLVEPYGRFLRFLRDKEAASTDKKNAINVHADGRRYRLHQIVSVIQNAKALGAIPVKSPQQASSSDSSTSSSSGATTSKPKSKSKLKAAVVDDEDEF